VEQRVRQAPRLAPLPPEMSLELGDIFAASRKRTGFIPNSQLSMQSQDAACYAQLSAAVWDPEGKVDAGLSG
jgi:hypothetical protein